MDRCSFRIKIVFALKLTRTLRGACQGANIVADVDGNEVVVYIRGINLIYADDGDKKVFMLHKF